MAEGNGQAESRKVASVSRQELERRWHLLRGHLAERGLDALVAQSARDIAGGTCKWLTDMPAANPRTVIFPAHGLMTVIDHGAAGRRRVLDGRDADNPGVGEIITTAAFQQAHYTQSIDAVTAAEVIMRHGYRRVALASTALTPHGFVSTLTRALDGKAKITDETDAVDRFKAVKSEEEIGFIRQAAELQDDIFKKVCAFAKPGMRDCEITAYAQYVGQAQGAEGGIFLGSSAPVGNPAFFAGRHMQGRTMREGDHMSLLIENNGPGGYYTELARTIVFGKASNELIDGFENCREAQAYTLSQMKPGVVCADIAAAHDAFMRGRSLPAEARLYSHSQGYDLVERPLVRADEPMTIEAGMNMAVHPAYATQSMFIVCCDNFLVQAGGLTPRLHKTEQKIFEL